MEGGQNGHLGPITVLVVKRILTNVVCGAGTEVVTILIHRTEVPLVKVVIRRKKSAMGVFEMHKNSDIHKLILVDGGWSEWSSSITSKCERKSLRECNSPSPCGNGSSCTGQTTLYEWSPNCTGMIYFRSQK